MFWPLGQISVCPDYYDERPSPILLACITERLAQSSEAQTHAEYPDSVRTFNHTAKPCICHTSGKSPSKSIVCHTSKNLLPQVLCLPHLRPPPPTSRGDECRVLPGRAFAGDAKVANAPISSPARSCCFRASLKQCCRTWGRVVTTEMRVTYT